MATIKKPVTITKPVSLTGSIKQTTVTTPTAKKILDMRKTPTAAPKTTSLASKTPSKPVVSKMASIKAPAATVDKASLKPVKSSVASPSKPVLVKAPVKRTVADSTTSDKESAAPSVRRLSGPTGLTKSTKIVTKPVTSSLTPVSKVVAAKSKSTLTDKLPAKPAAEKLPAKAKLTSSSLSKTSSPSTRPVSAPAKRPLTKMTDIKKPAVSKPAPAKSASKTPAAVVKPPSIITPIAGKKVIKKCTEVQICDADSTSVTTNDQLEFGLEYGTVAPRGTPVVFNETQAYKVAEQMMEALGTAVVTNDAAQQDALLKDSVVIDMSALEVAGQTETKVSEQATDCEPANQVDNSPPKEIDEKAFDQDLISFDEAAQEEPANDGSTTEDTIEGVAKAAKAADDATAESTHDQDEDIEPSAENQDSESDVPSDEAVYSGDESEPIEESISDEQIPEPSTEDETPEAENCEEFVDLEVTNSQFDSTSENEVKDENVCDYESCSMEVEASAKNIETDEQGDDIDKTSSTADPEITPENDEDGANPAEKSQPEQPEGMAEEVADPTITIEIQEDHSYVDSDPTSVYANSECNGDDFVVVGMGAENGDQDLEQVPLVDDCSATDAEKSADTESVARADSAVKNADCVKQPTAESAGDVVAIENEEAPVEVAEGENTCQQMVLDSGNQSAETAVSEKEVAVSADTADAEVAGEASAAVGDAEATDTAGDMEQNPVEEQTVKVEPLLGPMTDEVQQELDAGMEHSHTVDEEGYVKVQKKRNKRNNKRSRKSLKAFQKENTDFEPQPVVQESQDDLQVFQKRRNSRRAKNSTKKPNRRYSEPYSNTHCFSTPVWKSYYVEH